VSSKGEEADLNEFEGESKVENFVCPFFLTYFPSSISQHK